tara:strand:+ start:4711 stop:5025 length:315 start_codon:yes stop_codon:yes gene_type:complete
MTTWFTIFLCGILTFLTRFFPLSGLMPNELPLSLKKSLKYIPVVILTPIIINSLSIYEGTELYLLENNKLYAGLIAILVSTIFKNVLATISIGMLSYVLMSNIF